MFNLNMQKYWPLILALAVFSLLAWHLDFTQDDAYISYRYAANYLNGDGLVYNVGERIEGFTNFGWTIYLLLLGVLGANFILISKLTGFFFGAAMIVVTFLLARRILEKHDTWGIAIVCLLVGGNQSLAYWSPAGLETAAFAFFALWSLYLYLRRSWLLIFGLTMAVWIRPEGAVVTGIVILIEWLQYRRLPRFTLFCAAAAFVLSLPMVGFKLWYYGSILPNPFFAKTSFTLDQLSSGVEYTGRFLRHYAFYYVGCGALLAVLFWWRKHDSWTKAVWLFAVLYLAYVTLIGGDVLKVHRFFLPIIGTLAILYLVVLRSLTDYLPRAFRTGALIAVGLVMLGLNYELPRSFVQRYNNSEKTFTQKMKFKAGRMAKSDPRKFSVALATIGIFGYELLGHEIIDLVGLTDSTIARYSEDPIPGMQTTWKEQKHNSRYLLERGPDYIMFSTGIKPSAPAERALLLYRQFMDSYRTVGWFYKPSATSRGVMANAFKKVRPIVGDIVPTYPVEYVQEYKKALDAHSKSDHRTAIEHYDRAAQVSPQPYYIYLVYQKAFSLMWLGEYEQAFKMMNAVLERDSTVFEAHADLYRYAIVSGDTEKAAIHRRWLRKLVPWYWPRLDSITTAAMQPNR